MISDEALVCSMESMRLENERVERELLSCQKDQAGWKAHGYITEEIRKRKSLIDEIEQIIEKDEAYAVIESCRKFGFEHLRFESLAIAHRSVRNRFFGVKILGFKLMFWSQIIDAVIDGVSLWRKRRLLKARKKKTIVRGTDGKVYVATTLQCEHPGCTVSAGVRDYIRQASDVEPGETEEEAREWAGEPIALCYRHSSGHTVFPHGT